MNAMDERERLRSISRWRKSAKLDRAVRLGDSVGRLMEREISPRHARMGPVLECWQRLLPDELYRHCRITALDGGQLKVTVDSPSYMYELRMCSSELLETVQQSCPRARIRRINFVIG